jgi:hypothetical protein
MARWARGRPPVADSTVLPPSVPHPQPAAVAGDVLIIPFTYFPPPSGPHTHDPSPSDPDLSTDAIEAGDAGFRRSLKSLASNEGAKAGLGVAVAAVCVGLLLIIIRMLIRPHRRMSFKGKHCIVTGGSSGIGKDVAMVTN